MFSSLFSKRKFKGLNYLELTPFSFVGYEPAQDGEIRLLIPRFKNDFFLKFLSKRKSPYIRANLDKFGSAVWLMIDGKNRVCDIAESLTEKFGDEIQPVHDRLTLFLTQLYRNGFISFNELKKG